MGTECQYFSFVFKTGRCHVASVSSTMESYTGVSSGPKECPVTTPGPLTACNVHPRCVQQMETGMCCPNADGIVLGCCTSTPITIKDNSKVTVGSVGEVD